jgi:hypothetical protein
LRIDSKVKILPLIFQSVVLFSVGAYAYDDQETSSDSDDEVLKRYQDSLAAGAHVTKQDLSSRRSSAASKKSGTRPRSKVAVGELSGHAAR